LRVRRFKKPGGSESATTNPNMARIAKTAEKLALVASKNGKKGMGFLKASETARTGLCLAWTPLTRPAYASLMEGAD